MNLHDAALAAAGILGSGVAVVHGVLTQKLMVRPLEAMSRADGRLGGSIRRLVALLLHFSTFVWFLGGIALVMAAMRFGHDARLATCVAVGTSYAFGAVGNLWATRGRHPGWVLMAVALTLIAVGANRGAG